MRNGANELVRDGRGSSQIHPGDTIAGCPCPVASPGATTSSDGVSSVSRAAMLDKILALEAVMHGMVDRQIEFPITHHFAPGVYMREMFIPKGATLTGKIHKTEHLNILSQGELSVWTEGGMKRLKASTVIKSQPGIKRAGHAHEDSVWITVHHNPSDSQNIPEIEDRLVVDTFEQFYLASERTYLDAIRAHGFTHDEAWAITQRLEDQTHFPEPASVELKASPIHGMGMFATIRFVEGDCIGAVRVGSKRTPLGRYCNHSSDPNSEMLMLPSGHVDLFATRTIEPGQEIVNDYFYNFANTRPNQGLISGGDKP